MSSSISQQLSSEDELRLSVLLINAEAIRIDEQHNRVYGMAGDKELQVQLNPRGSTERYMQRVRAFLSTTVLGSPHHFPAHLQHWTGWGQIQNVPIDKLLLLGSSEAVYAVACAQQLTLDLARRVWWAAPGEEISRQLLKNPAVAASDLGKTLAHWLVDYLPFETNASSILEITRLLLQPGLIDVATRRRLWEMGRRDKAYRIGFLMEAPDTLPLLLNEVARADALVLVNRYMPLADAGNALAQLLMRNAGVGGQLFVTACLDVLTGVKSQDEVSVLLQAIGTYYGALRSYDGMSYSVDQLSAWADQRVRDTLSWSEFGEVLRISPEAHTPVRALVLLAQLDEHWVTPIFARSTASGSVMRKQIASITCVIQEAMYALQS